MRRGEGWHEERLKELKGHGRNVEGDDEACGVEKEYDEKWRIVEYCVIGKG